MADRTRTWKKITDEVLDELLADQDAEMADAGQWTRGSARPPPALRATAVGEVRAATAGLRREGDLDVPTGMATPVPAG